MTEPEATGIELLLSQPEIVAWLEQGHSTVDMDAPTFADSGEPLVAVPVSAGSGATVEATAAQSRVLASVSRELRAPLNEIVDSIRGVSRIDDLGKIVASAEHLLSRVDEIIDRT